jgi:hypothetical protein
MELKRKKSMVLPGAQDAPKFLSSKPKDLRQFISQLQDLWKEAGITDNSEKKESLGKYADKDNKDEWNALETYGPGYSWEAFKKELLDNYPEASAAERGTLSRIRHIVQEADSIELGDTVKLYIYCQAFFG